MPELFSTGAQLVARAGDTAAQGRREELARREQNLNTLQTTVQNIAGLIQQSQQQRGAMERQKLQGEQAIALEREKQKSEMLTITEPLAKGLAKSTGDESWMKLVGQEMPSRQVFPLYELGLKMRVKPITYKEGGKVVTKRWDWETNEWVTAEAPRNIWETEFPPRGGISENQRKLANLKTSIQNDKKALDDFLKKNDIPKEGILGTSFTIGKIGKLDEKEKAQAASLRATINRLRSNLSAEQTLAADEGITVEDRSQVVEQLRLIEDALPKQGDSGGSPDDLVTVVQPDGTEQQIYRKNLEEAKKRVPGLKVK